MTSYLQKKRFSEIDIADPFFDGLKDDYAEFEDWFRKKSAEEAYVLLSNEDLTGFMYLKAEDGPVNDVTPVLPAKKRLKVGTLKVEAHGTRLGERFLKKAFDHAFCKKAIMWRLRAP